MYHNPLVAVGDNYSSNLNLASNMIKNNNLLMKSAGGRNSAFRFQGRRAQSVDALNNNNLFQQRYYGQNILDNAPLQFNNEAQFHEGRLDRRWSKSSSLNEDEDEEDDQGEDEGRSYQDIPL